MSPLAIDRSSFTIVANGYADGPAQALRDYLLKQGAPQVVTVFHPLVEEGPHQITVFRNGTRRHSEIKLPFRPPFTYLLDPFVPARIPPTDVWFGFNNLACLKGLALRARHRVKRVVYWAVDFVPERFGRTPATWAYDNLDKLVSRRADFRVELSAAARDGRNERMGISPPLLAPVSVIPMGAWTKRVPKAPRDAFQKKKLVYLGHLVPRQGVDSLIRAIPALREAHPDARAEIVGTGPDELKLRRLASTLGVEDHVRFHGFVPEIQDVERILSDCSIAVAPYVRDPNSFTQFADPGKLKLYLATGLPILMTDVPPNALDLEKAGAATLIEDNPAAISEAARALLDNPERWGQMHEAAVAEAETYDWDSVLGRGLGELGITS